MQKTKKGKVILSERDIHYAVIDWVRAMTPQYPDLEMVVAYPSQGGHGKEAIIRGQIRKKEGQAKGFPDIMILSTRLVVGEFINRGGAFLEIKREGKKPRKEQLEWMRKLENQGYYVGYRDSIDGCIKFIKDYLGIK